MISILIETLDELGNALQAADLTRAETCRTFALRILGAKLQPNLEQIDTILDRAAALAAAHYGLNAAALFTTPGRADRIVHPRQLAMYLARSQGLKLAAIGSHFRKDHGTVIHGCRAVQDRIDTDPAIATAVQRMLTQLNPVAAEGTRLTSNTP